MDPKEESLLTFAKALREAGTYVREDYVEGAYEDKRYGDAAFATVAGTIFDRVLTEAENRLEEEKAVSVGATPRTSSTSQRARARIWKLCTVLVPAFEVETAHQPRSVDGSENSYCY